MIKDVLAAIRASKRDPIRISSHSSALFYVRIKKLKQDGGNHNISLCLIYISVVS